MFLQTKINIHFLPSTPKMTECKKSHCNYQWQLDQAKKKVYVSRNPTDLKIKIPTSTFFQVWRKKSKKSKLWPKSWEKVPKSKNFHHLTVFSLVRKRYFEIKRFMPTDLTSFWQVTGNMNPFFRLAFSENSLKQAFRQQRISHKNIHHLQSWLLWLHAFLWTRKIDLRLRCS